MPQSLSEFSFHRDLHKSYTKILSGKGNYLYTSDGRQVFDACTGAAVASLGYGNERVTKAISGQLNTGIPYLASSLWINDVVEICCEELVKGTGEKMAKAFLASSGSEAMEGALKLARQQFYEQDKQTPRINFISRLNSYHGNTLGALSVSGHLARREPYSPLLIKNIHHISPCYPYRQQKKGESDIAFVARKAAELEEKFIELGPETVIGFVAEPVVGAALGCVPSVPGYLKAMRDICHKYGALFILDEVMCGMGRTGTLHAWQAEDIAPDIQIVAKGLGGGYQPVAAVLISQKIIDVVKKGSGHFIHGLTYDAMPIKAAAALEVQRIIQEDKLLENVKKQGAYLEKILKDVLGDHPNVGDIRGRGLFWGLEFVKNKATKEPFDPKLGIAQKILDTAVSPPFNMTVYPGSGTVDGVNGDHIILAPSFIVTKKDVDFIITTVSAAIMKVLSEVTS